MTIFPLEERTFQIEGPAGALEVMTASALGSKKRDAVAIICHPHPQHGGTMHNKVITTLARVFHDLGLKTVRFNFRGIGKSEGQYSEKIGELEDLKAIVAWVKKNCPRDEVWIAGFSFGAYIAMRYAMENIITRLITVALPVTWLNQEETIDIQCPWYWVQGEEDDVVIPDKVYAFIEKLSHPPLLIKLPHAGHFFHGQLLELRRQLEAALEAII